MNQSQANLNREEESILNEMKELPLEMRLKIMRSDISLLKNKKTDFKTAKNNEEFSKKKKTRGGIRESSAKEYVHKNKVKPISNISFLTRLGYL